MPLAHDALSQLGTDAILQPGRKLDLARDPYVRERGSANLNLLDSGRKDMHEKGSGFAEQLAASASQGRPPKIRIFSSPWSRTLESGQILAQHLAPFKPDFQVIPELAPAGMGALEGEKSDEYQKLIEQLRTETTANTPPGRSKFTDRLGESYESYLSRILPVARKLRDELEANPNQVSIVAAHSSDMKAIHAEHEQDLDPVRSHTVRAQTDRMRIDPSGAWKYEENVPIGGRYPLIPGLYLQHHGDTEYNTARPEMLRGENEQPRNPPNPSDAGNASGTPSGGGSY